MQSLGEDLSADKSKPEPFSKPSLQEVMKKGREARRAEEQRDATQDTNSSAGDAAGETTETKTESGQREVTKDSNVNAGQRDATTTGQREATGTGQRVATAERPESGSDCDDDPMLIAGLSEVALLMKKPECVYGTGFLYDEFFTKHKNPWASNFPEKPQRVSESYKRCCELGLVDRCTRIQSRHGTEDQVLLQHTQEHINTLQTTVDMTKSEIMDLARKYHSVYFNESTYESALLAVGSTIEIMEQILKKNVRNGLALVRPPGHHAMESEFCGYCLFNNVAIAAKHAVDHLNLKRVLIVDWDVHHGQGTQQMFYNDPRVMYFSIHRYEYGKYWPWLRESDYDYIGEGEGTGYNINVPLNQTGLGDSDYLAILQQVLLPIAYEFSPELVLVSNGYDAAMGDMKGGMMVTPLAYAHFIHMMSSLAEGRVCAILEGGYNLKSLSEGVALTLRTLLGDPCPALKPTQEPSDSVTESILNVIKVLAPHWRSLQYQCELEEGELCPFDGVNEEPPREGVVFDTPENKATTHSLDSNPYPYNTHEEYKEEEAKWDLQIEALISETCLTVPPHRTCVVYDKAMKAHKAHQMPFHPEKPERISRIYNKHQEWGILDRCLNVKCRLAEEEELELCHTPAHIQFMKSLEEKSLFDLRNLQYQYNSIYFSKETYICARLAAGGTLAIVDTVLSGQAQNGVAIVRPPGHHAECGKPMGFCFFNSVAIAAKYAQKKYNVKRVLILDWDVHHGNGTQHEFYDDPSVLYISLHRYDGGFFYPGSEDGDCDKVGSGPGQGYNVNIPWHYGGKGDPEYIAAFQQIIMPIAYEFAPELVLVSAGFDAAIGDPLGGCKITPVGYGHMTHMLSSLANGRVIIVLEGGYSLVSIANCMTTCTSVLLGDSCPLYVHDSPQNISVDTICSVLDVHKEYWKSLKFRVGIPVKKDTDKPDENSLSSSTESSSKDRTEDTVDQGPTEADSSKVCGETDSVQASTDTDGENASKDTDLVQASTDTDQTQASKDTNVEKAVKDTESTS